MKSIFLILERGCFMGKTKSLGFQIYSALQEINLQDTGKRTEIFNKLNGTDFDSGWDLACNLP